MSLRRLSLTYVLKNMNKYNKMCTIYEDTILFFVLALNGGLVEASGLQ